MNDVYELVGIRGVSFAGSDGKQVEGTNLYLTYEDDYIDGVGTEKVFVTSKRFNSLSFVPEIGARCRLMYNKYGKVADIVPA
mgnify:FL=1